MLRNLYPNALFCSLLLALTLFFYTSATHADPLTDTDTGLEVGGEYYFYQYREPAFANLHGDSFGATANYTYSFGTMAFIKADATIDEGHLHYSSNGTGVAQGIKDYTQDYQGLVGVNLPMDPAISVSLYTGLGYRTLFDTKGEGFSSTGAATYDRRSRYLYIPLGLTAGFDVGDWILRPNVEGDLLARGLQSSYTRDLGYDNNVMNVQGGGYGVRGSFMISPPLFGSAFSIGPYARYWSINKSAIQTLYVQGLPLLTATEPANTTLEAGVRGLIKF